MTETIHEDKVTEETLDTDVRHGFCDHCYNMQIGSLRPDYLVAVCGAVVLSSQVPQALTKEEAKRIPANACPACLSAELCARCGQVP